MKKSISMVLSIIVSVGLLAGCGSTPSSSSLQSASSTLESASSSEPESIEDSSSASEESETLAAGADWLSDYIASKTGSAPEGASVVYLTTDISPEGLMAIYEALGREATGNVAVKVHTGEPGGKNFLRPEFMSPLVQSVNGTFIESNTAYGGQRASTAMHYQVAKDHGFNDVAPMVILDEEASMPLPIQNGTHFSENLVGARLADFDFLISIAHFKGHMIGGFGGTLKNMSIGIASTAGKNRIHTAGDSDSQWMGGIQDEFLESMAEATQSVVDYFGKEKVLFINVMNKMSVDCDCSGARAAEPEIHDIGILASLDPVALDQACIDLIYGMDDPNTASLIERIESRNGAHVIDHGAQIGLGSQEYELLSIDN